MNKPWPDRTPRRRPNSSKGLASILAKACRPISAKRRRPISIALAAVAGAVAGGVIADLDYAAFLADLHHREGIGGVYLDYVVNHFIGGAIVGAVLGVLGYAIATWAGYRTVDDQKIVIGFAGAVVLLGIAACGACVVMAAFGVTVAGIPDHHRAVTVGDLLILFCSYAAGVVVSAARARS